MFEQLFAAIGPLGSAAILMLMLAVIFAIALSETLRAARPGAPPTLLELAGGLSRTRLTTARRWIARAETPGDSRARHATTPCALVRRYARLAQRSELRSSAAAERRSR